MNQKIQAFFNTIVSFILVASCLVFSPLATQAATLAPAEETSEISDDFIAPPTTPAADTYYRARVVNILEEGLATVDGATQYLQKLELKILNGNEKGKTIFIDHGGVFAIDAYQKVSVGDIVVVTKPVNTPKQDFYYIVDKYRVPGVTIAIIIFFALALFFGRRRGITALVGLISTIGILFYGVVPHIVKGANPLVTCMVAALLILVVSLYLSHGFNKRTTIALVSSLATLIIAVGIDLLFVYVAHLGGNGTEEAFYLQFDNSAINLKGLLLGSILLGVVGVLDDITTAQTAALEEIAKANPARTVRELYHSGLSIGREHIASLVNTLVLAYVGASFPLIILFVSQRATPLWLALNSAFIAEEVVRTLVGSSALVIAVPITTILAAYYYGNKKSPGQRMSFTAEQKESAPVTVQEFWDKR